MDPGGGDVNVDGGGDAAAAAPAPAPGPPSVRAALDALDAYAAAAVA